MANRLTAKGIARSARGVIDTIINDDPSGILTILSCDNST
jgi:hypothetical protein